ncbi:uncharacterized protein LOC121375627 [Gigantopelta aegis]|uniref:uncharacterized protein LOC121375627 n=1 Tax=Gigantopelta aegis TaxID=1735272 RepID=UPI001B88C253|nr:uncharacterized protein LOC121375627 [Gigantopelta aegis]
MKQKERLFQESCMCSSTAGGRQTHPDDSRRSREIDASATTTQNPLLAVATQCVLKHANGTCMNNYNFQEMLGRVVNQTRDVTTTANHTSTSSATTSSASSRRDNSATVLDFLNSVSAMGNSSGWPDQVKDWTSEIHGIVHHSTEIDTHTRTVITRALVTISRVSSVDHETFYVRFCKC